MTLFTKEVATQEVNRAHGLLKQRRLSRVAFVASSYGVVIISGFAAAALIVGSEQSATVLAICGISGLAALLGVIYSRFQIRQSNVALDKSLDVLAAMRALAIEADEPARERGVLRAQYQEIHRQRERRLFGVERRLF